MNCFPPGDLSVNNNGAGDIPQASTHAFILPFLEGGNQYSTFNFNFQVNGNNNNSLARIQVIPTYHCSSDPAGTKINNVSNLVLASSANYMQSLGATALQRPTPPLPSQYHGPFFTQSAIRFAQIQDGTSNTALFSEIRKGPNGANATAVVSAGDSRDYQVATDYSGTFSANDLILYPTACNNRSTSAWLYRGLQYYRGLIAATYYTHTLTPNSTFRDCVMQSAVQGHAAARSYHPSGVNVGMADGSVRFATNNVNAAIWAAVGTINNGETVTDF